MLRLLLAFSLVLSACAAPARRSDQGPQFTWPVKKARMTQRFKPSGSRHDGLDLAATKNAPIYAAAGGRVIYTGRDFNGFGKLIIIEHQGDRWASFYAHLNDFAVREGQWVNAGQKIGLMGKTGNASGVHLHFEIRKDRSPVDPLALLPRF